MPALQISHPHKKTHTAASMGQLLFGWFGVFCLALLMRNSEIAIEYISRGLLLCTKTVIPTLFPFMVLSELIVSSGSDNRLLHKLAAPLRRLFGLPTSGCCAVILGMLCGFPIGAKCALIAYERGELTKEQAERVLTFSNNPSSAFLISAVGLSLWENRKFGIVLYITVLGVSAFTGAVLNLFQKSPCTNQSPTHRTCTSLVSHNHAKLFTGAVRSAGGSILLVCAYVIFFSALIGTMTPMLQSIGMPVECNAFLFCLFEISSGMSAAAGIGNVYLAALFSAFAAGWSGFSVHCQVLSLCDGTGLSLRPYFITKLAQGLLCALIFGAILFFFPELTMSGHAA